MMTNGLGQEQVSSGVPKGYGQTAYKRGLAYAYLGIRPSDVPSVAFFPENLRRIARFINRGRSKEQMIHPFDYLLSSKDTEGRKVADLYFSVPKSYRRLLPPQAYCHAAGVSPNHVLGIITSVAIQFGAMASAAMASTMLPQVVDRLIAKALQPDGTKDRELFLRLAEYLPTRKSGW